MLLTLTFGKETFKLDSSNTETVCDLKAQIEALTDIWPVRQKLICRGKVLQDSQVVAELPDNSKLMLVSSDTASRTQVPSGAYSPTLQSLLSLQHKEVR